MTAVDTDSKNKYGQTLTQEAVTVEDSIVPTLAEITVDGEDVTDVKAIEEEVVLTFEEDINPDKVSLVSFEVAGYNVTAVDVTDNVITLTVARKAGSTLAATPKVGTKVTQKATVKDANGNSLTGLSAEVAVSNADVTPPIITNVVIGGTTDEEVTAQDTLTFTFSEATDKPALTDSSFATGLKTLVLANNGSATWNAAGTELVVVLGDNPTITADDTINFVAADTVEDLAGNDFGTEIIFTVPTLVGSDF
ncbi:hypothetical protein M3649_13440 [Ureibacillus chungkukjangi]|uniref:hypothetical protein n=1 Tax=Ureibacillus chungkukjangi TaxID=1202712 RepID=UPI00203CBFD1|nr:hypothetical protein [Ureibacillus chungkukjangi]MCM3389140.1 hypothetical protein [Ureibacillus chungkukjangi]